MLHLVYFPSRTLSKFHPTKSTLNDIWFFSGMNPKMSRQIRFLDKRLVTDRTFEWFFSSMNPHVNLKALSTSTDLLTNGAFQDPPIWSSDPGRQTDV